MFVADILKTKSTDVISTGPETSVGEAARLLTKHRIGAVVVLDDAGALIGVFSERDVIRGLAAEGAGVLDRPVSGLMTREVVTTAPDKTIAEVMHVMTERRFRHLPVVADGALKGMISIGDVVKHRLVETEAEAQALRDYVLAGH